MAFDTPTPGAAAPTTEQLIEADRRAPDVVQFGGGVSTDEHHAALRASVRQLGTLLGEALTRHEGPELLELVERVRALSREPDDGTSHDLHELLSGVDARTAIVLARAFTAYFQLVNVTEQLHRWQELTTRPERPLAATTRRIGEALEAARQELAGLPVAGLVLVTDGADTSNATITESWTGDTERDVTYYWDVIYKVLEEHRIEGTAPPGPMTRQCQTMARQ